MNLSKEIKEEGYISNKNDEFVIKEVSTQGNWKSIKAKLNVEDLEGKVFESFDTTNETIIDCINLALAGTGWIVGTCNVTKRRTVRKTNSSSWDIIQEARKVYRCELEFDTLNKKVNIYEKRGSDKGVYFLDSLNLKDLSIQSDSYEFYTRIIAKGKDDLKVTLENFQYSNKVKTYIWKDERYTNIESLTEDAEAKLGELSKPYRSYSATVIDLANISKEDYKDILSYALGDVINLVSKENGIKEKQRIVKMIEYPDEPNRNTCEIANTTLSFEDVQKEFEDTSDTVNNITTDNGTIDGSTINGITTEQIHDFEASVGKITNLTIVNARIDELYAKKANISELNAVVANVAELNATKANITELNATNANIGKLVAEDAKINNVLINKADITELNAVNGKINVLESDTANIKNLLAGNISGESGQLIHLTASNVVVADAVIKDLIAANISVGDLKASTISTNKFSISSTDGGLSIVGPTMQFKDKNNKVRIQIGQDTQGNFNFILRGADGTTTLIDHTGIKEKAIADNLIKENMVAADAIGEKQINYSSLITGLNKDTNTSLIKASKVAIDLTGQSLEVSFNSLKSNVDNIQVGGRNLLLNSNKTVGENSSIEFVQFDDIAPIFDKYGLIEYTISFDIKSKNVSKNNVINVYGQNGSNVRHGFNASVIVTTEWQRKHVTVTPVLSDESVAATMLAFYGVYNTGNIPVVKNVKIEKGNKATDWTPAPEDINNAIEDVKQVTESNSTTIGVMQGQISTAINNTQIVKDNKTILLKDDYNRTVAKVDSINSTIGSQATKLDKLTGKITDVDTKVNSVKRDLEGTTSTVSSHTTQIDGLNTKVSTQSSTISQLKDKIALKVEKTDITNAINNINIGGKNYVLKSDYYITGNNYMDFDFSILQELRGKTVTVSVEVDLFDAQGTRVGFEPSVRYADGTIQYFGVWQDITSPTTMKKRISLTHTILDKEIISYDQRGIYIQGVVSGTTRIGRPKLEIGNQATDWTPAPEDVDSSISNIQTQVNTTKNQVAEIVTNVDSITQRVSSTESTTAVISSNLGVTTNIANNALNTANSANNKVDSVQIEVTTTKNQVASIETNLNSIAQRVSNTESLSAKIEDINYLTKVAGVELLPQLYRTGNNNGYFANGGWLGNYLNDRIHIQGQTWVTTDFIKFDRSKPLYFKFNYYNENGMLYVGIERYRQDKSVIENADNGACYYLFTRGTNTNGYENYEGYFNESSSETAYIKLRILSNWDNRPGFSQSLFPEISFRQLQGNIQDNIIYHEQRIQSAEQKITPTAITTTISEVITGGTGSISTTQFVMDKNGFTIKNGALTIKNKAGTTVFQGDSNGNIRFTGTITGSYADLKDTLLINGQGGNGWAQILLRSSTGLEGNIYTGGEKSLNMFAPNGIYIGGYRAVLEDKDDRWKMWTTNGGIEKGIYFEPVNGKIYSEVMPLTLSSVGGRVQTETNFYVNGSCNPMHNATGGMDLGSSALRWYTLYSVTSVNTSDKKYKENIKYVDEEALLINEAPKNKYYDFIKNDLKVAEYDYIRNGESRVEDHQIGFIANDIIATEIGSKFCYELDKGLGFSATGYTTIVAKALQEAIKKIELLEEKIKILESNSIGA